VIKEFGFTQNFEENCIYKKMNGSVVAFLVLYVDAILLVGNDMNLLKSLKDYLNIQLSKKYMGEASYILGI
jgi:hypothetical protein